MKTYKYYKDFSVLVFFLSLFLFAGCEAAQKTKKESMANKQNLSAEIISMERAALDRWAKGDPDGFLEISAADITYFDPSLEARLDGIEALAMLYVPVRGHIQIDRYEMINPTVQVCGDSAVLTFNFVATGSEGNNRWNCTEVYSRRNGKWQIIHTHWSMTNP